MSSIFKRKKSKHDIEDVVVEKVIAADDPAAAEPLPTPGPLPLPAEPPTPAEASDQKCDSKSSGKGLRFFFSLSRSSKRADDADQSHDEKAAASPVTPKRPARDEAVTNQGDADGDTGCAKSLTAKKKWSRSTKSSPPPPPTTTATTVTTETAAKASKVNGIVTKAPAPLPPVMSSPGKPPFNVAIYTLLFIHFHPLPTYVPKKV
jgi:hypothetical protein